MQEEHDERAFQITAVRGPLKGMSWPIGEHALTIGRSHRCDIVVPEESVSREHCKLVRDDGSLHVHDLDSANATLVNGSVVRSAKLEAGDQIQVGSAAFLISTEEVAHPHSGVLEEATTITVSEDEVAFLDADLDTGAIAGQPQSVRDLATLFGVGREMSMATSRNDLFEILHAALRERFATRDIWILRFHTPDKMTLCEFHGDLESPKAPVPTEVCQGVLETKRAVLRQEGKSMLLAAPMRASGATFGVVALRVSVKHSIAARRDLEFLLALSSQAAPFMLSVEHAEALRVDLEHLRKMSGESSSLLGESRAMKQVRSLLQDAAGSDLSVLILGETGTGKELAARLVHDASERGNGPFVAINCAAIPQELFESELFGYEKGAFTGATARKTGLIEQAHGGTLFLDEVADLSLANQARVLRAIELGRFHRLGAKHETKVDVRIVSATNADLSQAVSENAFRLDLYHRLRGVEVVMPPLRDRRSDIPLLAQHFLAQARSRAKRPITGFTEDAIQYLSEERWPGNVRELRTAIERAIVFVRNDLIDAAVLKKFSTPGSDLPVGQLLPLAEVERMHIEAVLRECEGNISAAARMLEVSRATIYNKVRDYGIEV